jgi:enterobactin synthetase component F
MLRSTAFAPGVEGAPVRAPEPSCTDADPFLPGTTDFPLTIAQAPIALDAMAFPNSPVANTGDIAHIHGTIDTGLFAAAVRRVVAETPAMRASLRYIDGALRQEFLPLDDYLLELRDLSRDDDPDRAAELWIEKLFWQPRPWNSFPLFHFALLKTGDDHYVFLQKFHHLLADASGRFQCLQRIASVYEALVQGAEPPPRETQPLTDRLAEEATYLNSSAYRTDLAYWNSRLEPLPEPLVESDRGASERGRSGRPLRLSHPISPEAFTRLKDAATVLGSSVPRLALALTYIGLSRLYGVTDIVIGTPMHNRATPGAKQSIDLAMTVMPFRMTFQGDITMAKLLKDIASKQMADRRRSRFPFASFGRSLPIYDVMFNYIPAMEPVSLGQARVTHSNYSAGFYSPLTIDLRETDGGAILTVVVDQGLIAPSDGARLAQCLQFLLTNPIAFEKHTIVTIPLVSDCERRHLLVELNDNDMPIPSHATLASLCAAQAERTPDAIAATCGTQFITYAHLHAKAEALAQHLAASGVLPDIVVGVALPRNIDLIVTLLAIHKAGGAYLPLDLSLPPDRIAYMVADAGAPLIVTTTEQAGQLPPTGAGLVCLDDPQLSTKPDALVQPVAAGPENLAYVIYTSGSTGMPKGVAVEHRSAVNLALSLIACTPPEDLDGILFSTSLSFDVSVDQLFMSLAGGGRLIIMDSLLALPAASARSEVRIVEAAPSVFEALLRIGGYRPGARLIRFCGEALPRSLVDRVLAIDPHVRIENAYGPTETTVYASIAKVSPDSGEPSIGKGLWNTKLYVLDRHRQLLPKGAKGELYIGGLGVARGYRGRPELTAERFLQNPFGEGRIYRTGDIVRWRNDGELEYFRRTDDQVKINGLRVELGEIERQLESMPEITQAAAVIHADDRGTKRIFAFAIARDNRPVMNAVTAHLHKTLPNYMMPAALTWVEKFPLTPSGKLDRKALSPPQCGPERPYRAPSNQDEVSLARIWCQVLAIPKIGAEDDFFDLGGTSLQAVMIFARISRAHGFDLPASTMVRAPTIALQAALLEEIWRANDRSLLVAFRERGDGAPVFFMHGGGGGVMHVRDLMQDLKCSNPLYGLHAPAADGAERLPRRIENFAAAYIAEIRKVQPAGPYHLIGFSAGGTIAYEMARQLQEAGETVSLLGIIETNTGRYRSSIRQARAAFLHRLASGDISPYQAAKQTFGAIRKSMKRLNEKMPCEVRHALGLAVPYDEREYFYMRWFRDIEASYTPGPYRGPITLFASQPKLEAYRTMWSDLASGGLTVRDLPEAPNHSSVVLLPNSRFLAAQIDASLDELAAG